MEIDFPIEELFPEHGKFRQSAIKLSFLGIIYWITGIIALTFALAAINFSVNFKDIFHIIFSLIVLTVISVFVFWPTAYYPLIFTHLLHLKLKGTPLIGFDILEKELKKQKENKERNEREKFEQEEKTQKEMKLAEEEKRGLAEQKIKQRQVALHRKYAPVLETIRKFLQKYPDYLRSSNSKIHLDDKTMNNLYEQQSKLLELIKLRIGNDVDYREIKEVMNELDLELRENILKRIIGNQNKIENCVRIYLEYFGEDAHDEDNVYSLSRYLKKIYFKNHPLETVYRFTETSIEQELKKIKLEVFEESLLSDTKIKKINLDEIDTMKGHAFQEFLSIVFEKKGYKVNKQPLSNDYGADLILEKLGKKIIVQAKRYAGVVPNSAIQEAHTAKEYFDCDEAWIVTQSRLSKNSEKMAQKLRVKIIDREKLSEYM